MTYVVKPSGFPDVCCVVQPIERPSLSCIGTLVVSAEPVSVVAPPPPSANLPVGQVAALPGDVTVMIPAIEPPPAGPVGPVGPVAPFAPAGPVGPAAPLVPLTPAGPVPPGAPV